MTGRYTSLGIVVAALVCYHVAQRAMPATVRPGPLFAVVYATAGLVMLTAMGLTGSIGAFSDVPSVARHWQTWAVAGAVLGIELGYLAMYRSGWSASAGSVVVQTFTALMLVGIGLIAFHEHLTPGRVVGLALCLVGAGLIAH